VRVRLLEAPLQALPNVVEKNAFSFFTLASGVDNLPDFEAFFMPFDMGTFICVALGLRPAPAACRRCGP
jgi:hypothetical protein